MLQISVPADTPGGNHARARRCGLAKRLVGVDDGSVRWGVEMSLDLAETVRVALDHASSLAELQASLLDRADGEAELARAELEPDPQRQASWLRFVLTGAGPTGVEIVGRIAQLARHTLPAEFRDSCPRAGQVLLAEPADRVQTLTDRPAYDARLKHRVSAQTIRC